MTAPFALKDLIGKYLPFYGVHDWWLWFRLGDSTIECAMPTGPNFRDERAGGLILIRPASAADSREEDSRFVDQPIANLRIVPGFIYGDSKVPYFHLEDETTRPWLAVSTHGGFKFTPPPGLAEILEIADHAARNVACAAYLKERL